MIISLDAKKIKRLIKCLSLHVKKKKKQPTKQAKKEIDKKTFLNLIESTQILHLILF